jgi:hypothetical protein
VTDDKSVKVYPNPNNGRFILALSNFEGSTKVSVANMLGTVIYKTEVNENLNILELSYLDKGLYFFTIRNGKSIYTKKVIVQ